MQNTFDSIRKAPLSITAIIFVFIYGLIYFQIKTHDTSFESIIEKGSITILTTNQPSTYFIGSDDSPQGPEFSLTKAFANSLGLKVQYKVFDSTLQVLEALENNAGDIAAASLTITKERKRSFLFGPSYLDIQEYLVCHRSQSEISSLEELGSLEIIVADSSSYLESLAIHFPSVPIKISQELSSPQILEGIEDKHIQCTISDSHIFDINRRYYPSIDKKYLISEGNKIAWMMNTNASALQKAVTIWFDEFTNNNEFEHYYEKYYGYIDEFDYVDVQKFRRRVDSRLPKYTKTFMAAAAQNELSPTLLMAQSYQESHWDPRAKSFTGVRGMMMLTLPVANSFGVKSRLNAEENIIAGAKYFAKLKKMFKTEVQEPDRTWMALAAYNVGRGHFRDAQNLARKLGKSPYKWVDIKDVLPLLSEKKYYKDLRYGYARGNEPVQYVQRVRDYENILVNMLDTKEN